MAEEISNRKCDDDEVLVRIGPQLAPDALVPVGGIGPVLPEHAVRARLAAAVDEQNEIDIGAIGPLLPGNEVIEELRHNSDQRPANSQKSADSSGETKALQRESWMTDYLPVSQDPRAALKPRKFRQGAGPSANGIDVSWFKVKGATESDQSHTTVGVVGVEDPSTARIPKPDPHMQLQQDLVSARDNQMLAVANSYNKKHGRQESLLERHQRHLERKKKKARKKAKRSSSTPSSSSSSSSASSSSSSSDSNDGKRKKKHRHHHSRHRKTHKKDKHDRKRGKKTSEPVLTRQPFDRDRDLFASQIDPLKRRAIIERSRNLGTRFAHGGQKFL